MDFTPRSDNQGAGGQPTAPATNTSTVKTHSSKKKLGRWNFKEIITGILLIACTVIVVAVIAFIVINKPKNEGQYVDKSKMQAVFLNGGQVYFGNISELNREYAVVGNIYYLRVNQQVQPGGTQTNDISLVKLGCELHGPQDNMVINREQMIFWENLKDDGQVAKAVAEYIKANPNGQKCEQPQQNTKTDTTKP